MKYLLAILLLFPFTSHAAIAFVSSCMDNSTGVARATATCNIASCSTSNALFYIYPYTNGTTYPTTINVSVNGVAATEVNHVALTGGGFATGFYLLGATTTGNQAVVVSVNPTKGMTLQAGCYSGAQQSSQPDNSTTNTGTGTSLATNLTVNTANSWIMTSAVANTEAPNAGTNFTIRQTDDTSQGSSYGDSNAGFSTGSQSVTVTAGASSNFAVLLAAFKPAVANTFDFGNWFPF